MAKEPNFAKLVDGGEQMNSFAICKYAVGDAPSQEGMLSSSIWYVYTGFDRSKH